MKNYDVIVIGGGPAGLSAALSAYEEKAKVGIIEREARLGGILKQCIHDGFGLIRFGEKLSGPEYVGRDIDDIEKKNIDIMLLAFVTRIRREEDDFILTLVSRTGVEDIKTKTIVLATGCRERTAKQIRIHGTRPAGVITAGSAQNLVNLHGLSITKKCVILGSGDIGLIMARRLTLEGSEVLGVYEVMPEPAGLARNISQCLNDYNIPLHLSHTVTRVFGHDRLEAVEIAEVDEDLIPILGTEKKVECDALILSVGLIPENELAEDIGVEINKKTKGPLCDGNLMSTVPGVFAAGNCLYVYDLVDYVSEDGAKAGRNAAKFARERFEQNDDYVAPVKHQKDFNLGTNEMTCIVCPNGCRLSYERTDDGIEVSGNKCPKGEKFLLGELTEPKRTISSTVATAFKEYPVVPVRVSGEIPKDRIFDVMKEINKVYITEKLPRGYAVIENVLNLGVDVILTGDELREAENGR